jgi:hypothetical protein
MNKQLVRFFGSLEYFSPHQGKKCPKKGKNYVQILIELYNLMHTTRQQQKGFRSIINAKSRKRVSLLVGM